MESRFRRIEKALGGNEPRSHILFVDLAAWPEDDHDAYHAGTSEQRADLIEQHCGRRPAPGSGRHITTIIDHPPPPLDSVAAVREAETIVRKGDANDNPQAMRETTRGVTAGWRDVRDDPDDQAELRAQAEATERRQLQAVKILSTCR